MSILYIIIKLYPFFGISLGVLSIDLMVSMRRKHNKAWIGFLLFSILFFASSVTWIVLRGDIKADHWYGTANESLK